MSAQLSGIVFGIVAAALLGTSDFWAARAARTVPAVTVTRTVLGVSAMLAPVMLLAVPSHWSVRDSLIAGASGLSMMTGLAMLYRGYSVARIGLVAPTSSVLIALVPVVYDAVRGVRPGVLGAAGMALGLVGVALATYEPRGGSSLAPGDAGARERGDRAGVVLGAASGVAFGVAFSLMSRTSKASGLSTIVVQRVLATAVLSLVRFVHRAPLFASRSPSRLPAVIAGLSAGVALASLQIGYRHGSAGSVSVAASQFATVAVGLSVVFNRERLRQSQAIGIGAAAVGVALLALG